MVPINGRHPPTKVILILKCARRSLSTQIDSIMQMYNLKSSNSTTYLYYKIKNKHPLKVSGPQTTLE